MSHHPPNHDDDDDSDEFELNLDEFNSDLPAADKTGSDSDVNLLSGPSVRHEPASTPNDARNDDVTPPNDFTDILIRRRIIDADQLLEARDLQQKAGGILQDVIVKLSYATAGEVMSAIAEFHGLQFVDLTEVITIPQAVLELVPESVARENIVLPLAQANAILEIVMSDPSDVDLVQKLQFLLNKEIQPVLAPREQIIEAINRHYRQTETESVESMLLEFTDTAIQFDEAEATQARAAVDENDPLVKLINLIIAEAVSLGASAIHIEPLTDRIRVRYRMDGLLVERDSPPRRVLKPLMSRIKVMANIAVPEPARPPHDRIRRLLAPLLSRIKTKSSIAVSARPKPERPQPQDGRMKTKFQGGHTDLRVSILPTDQGESAVMRIVDRRNVEIGIADLGLQQDDQDRFHQIIKRANGLFLLTGRPGCGTTTTLYVALSHLNRPDRKIIAVEDPVEYCVPGINQVEVKSGPNCARAIRDVLRQGPDIIAVGEIRDRDTANMAAQASLAGHLVLSTLRSTGDAPSAIARLIDLGVQPFLIAGSVTAIMAQRLVRVVCPRCKELDEPDAGQIQAAGITLDKLANATLVRGRGCNYCNHTGYRGRTAIFELLNMSAAVREMTCNRAPTQEIRRQARSLGMRTLLEDGVNKAARGVTSLEEVLGACRHELRTEATDLSDP